MSKKSKNSKPQLIIKHYLRKIKARNLNKEINTSLQLVGYQAFPGNWEE